MKTSIAILISTCAMIMAWFLCPFIIIISEFGISIPHLFWWFVYDHQGTQFIWMPGNVDYWLGILITGPSLIFIPEVARLLTEKSSRIEGIIVALLSIIPQYGLLYGTILSDWIITGETRPVIPTPFVIITGVLCLVIFKSSKFAHSDETRDE